VNGIRIIKPTIKELKVIIYNQQPKEERREK
jgi:hypothetical protein